MRTVGENSWKEVVAAETDQLIRTVVLWRDWNVAGPEINLITLFWAGSSTASTLTTIPCHLCVGTNLLNPRPIDL